MRGEFRNIIKVACIYMTTIIGAGFASGQEIMQFFSSYYEGGFYGILFAGFLFSVIGYMVLDRVYRERIRNYDEFLFPMMGWFMGWVVEIFVTLFMLSLFCIMIAGSANILKNSLGIPYQYAVIIMSVACMLVILTSIKGVVALSTVVTPILIMGILVVGFYVIINKDVYVFSISGYFNKITDNWFFSSLLYVSYNSILSIVVMSSLLPYLKTRKIGIMGGILGGAMLCFIAFVLNTILFLFYPESVSNELPVLKIVEKYSDFLVSAYTVILWLAMLVSAVTSGYCAIERISSKMTVNTKLVTAIMCALAVPLSSFGFSSLIATLYPFFGYIGLFILLIVFIQGIRILPGRVSRRKLIK